MCIAILLILASHGSLCENSVQLAYDDGGAEDGIWVDETRGHAVLFAAPSEEWTITGVEVYGGLVSEPGSDMFVIEVWDEDLNLISKVTDRTRSFFGDEFSWVLVDIPKVRVSGDFVVCLYEFGGIYVGVDQGPSPGRSYITARSPNRILDWNLASSQQNRTDWMIRVIGYSPAPMLVLNLSSQIESEDKHIKIYLKAEDPDCNLKSAMVHLVDNESHEVIWSEIISLDGCDVEMVLNWSGSIFQVSTDRVSISPVFAISNFAIYSENISQYLAYSAICILELEPGSPQILASAYFGEDGKFNALIDVEGHVHYMSREVLEVIEEGAGYMTYKWKNITLIDDKSSLTFGRMVVTSDDEELAFVPYDPVMLTGSPLFNYGLQLKQVKAVSGEYKVIALLEDGAYNVVRDVGVAEI